MRDVITFISRENEIDKLNNRIQQSRGTLIEIHTADLHFGVMNPKTQYDILCEQLLNKVVDIPFDIFSINGDIFDHKFMSNSDVVMYATMFIDNVVNMCRQKGATLFIIAGTELHDSGQLKLFYHYLADKTVDVRIVEEVKFEYTKGAKILCIPELYNKGEEYYKNIMYTSWYDAVFMHGTYTGSIYNPNPKGLDSDREVTFKFDDFQYCKGPIISGHVHTQGCFDKYIYYCGSPLRWRFGEEQPKGFLIVLHNLDTQEHYTYFEEIQSFRYDTFNLDHMLMCDPKDVIEYVNKLKEQGIHNIRLEFTSVDEKTLPNFNIINNYYKNSNSVKIKSSYSQTQKIMRENSEVLSQYTDYDYVLDPKLSPNEIFCRYVNQQKGYQYITVDKLIEILKEI